MEKIEDVIKRVENGVAMPGDIAALTEYLRADDQKPKLYETITAYMRSVETIDWHTIMPFVRWTRDPMVSYVIVAKGSHGHEAPPEFWTAVEQIALGEAWDTENDVRIQAILALGRSPRKSDEGIRTILKTCLSDQSPVVRDTAVVAAQRCLGIPEPEILWGRGEGRLIDRMPSSVAEWLSGIE